MAELATPRGLVDLQRRWAVGAVTKRHSAICRRRRAPTDSRDHNAGGSSHLQNF